MGGGIQPGSVSGGLKHGGDHRCSRPFSVRSCDVDRMKSSVRIMAQMKQSADIAQPELHSERLEAVEVLER